MNFEVAWKNLNDTLFCPRARDVLWRVMHNALTVRAFLHEIHVDVRPQCVLCQAENETLDHLFLQCPIVKPVWTFVNRRLGGVIGQDVRLTWKEIFYLNFDRPLDPYKRVLYLTTSELIRAIWTSRNRAAFCFTKQTAQDIQALFLFRFRSRLKADFHRLPRDVFNAVWCRNNSLCAADSEELKLKI